MALFSTYADLKTAVADWLNRSDLTAKIPDFIRLAEVMFEREIRWRGMIAQDVVSAGVDEQFESLPSDYLELKSIWFNTNPVVRPQYCVPSVLEDWIASNPGAQGTPQQYTLLGDRIKFDRIATGAPVLYLETYVKVPYLNDSTQTSNALLAAAPDIYLYGTLMVAEPYLKNDPRLATWTALYQSHRDKLHLADKHAQAGPSPLVMRSKRPAFS